ncbi:MAG: CPBP family intramembrane metalloprotease [Chitinophagaceae bacterium]|nr:CPBP family intramembrane metalloprotease [Chitinophagaceae bacterium]
MNQRQQISYPLQFLMLLGLVGLFMIFGSILVAAMGSNMLGVSLLQVPDALNRPQNANISRLLNTLATLIAFLIPAILFAKILTKQPFAWLGFSKKMSGKQALIVVLITFAGMILSGSLGMLNQKIPLPEDLLKQAQQLENTYKNAMMNMAHMTNFSDYLLAMLVMALAPALFEEVLFRGAFQQVFVGWTKNAWAGIIITSILFSAIHFSFFGFLPRIALGLILGLIFYYTNNLWLSILLHFLNNGFVVTQLYILSAQGKAIDKVMDETMPIWWGSVALILLGVLFRLLLAESKQLKTEKIVSHPEMMTEI